jgi:hypothetical protein
MEQHFGSSQCLLLSTLCVAACGGAPEPEPTAQSTQYLAVRVPGLVMGLLHNSNQASAGTVMYSALASEADHRDGGDLGAPNHRGYEWWSLPDQPGANPASFVLPPGVVVALKHSANQNGQAITAFGRDATTGADFPGFRRQSGGDRGASAGTGYYWYESTGVGFTNWASIDSLLPKYTVVGLKHSMNQASKVFVWNGVTYNPVNPSPVPPGFRRMVGGDLGAPAGQGYFWYEKTTGEEIVTQPTLTRSLSRTIFMTGSDSGSLDKDGDCLVDSLENTLATFARPYVAFDSSEHARQSFEPVTLYRVFPLSASKIRVRYEFLFAQDGGYGPSSWCSNPHGGDTDVADYDLTTTNGGSTWRVTKVSMSDGGAINWPGSSRLEIFDKTFPVIYMSGSKHHEYLTRDNDEHDSAYSSSGCNDDVDGTGARFVVAAVSSGLVSNNVGEPVLHPPSRFAGDLPMFPLPGDPSGRFSVWDGRNFYSSDAGPIAGKFPPVTYPTCPNGCAHTPCRQGPPLSAGCFSEVASICAADPYCCNTWWDALCVNAVSSGCQ